MADKKIKYTFAGDSSELVKAADKALETLSAFEKSLKATAKQANIAFDAASFNKFSDGILRSVENVKLLNQQFKEFSRMYGKGGYQSPNIIDRYIQQQEAQTKSARESFYVMRELFKEREEAAKRAAKEEEEAAKREAAAARERQQQEQERRTNYVGKEYLSGFRGINQVMEKITSNTYKVADALSSFGTRVSSASGMLGKLGSVASSAGGFLAAIAPYIGVIVVALGLLIKVVSKVVSVIIKALQQIAKALTPVVKLMSQFIAKVLEISAKVTVGTIFAPVISAFKSLGEAVKQTTSNIAEFTAGFMSGASLAEATKNAINMIEVQNLFNVAMKDNIATGNEFINTLSEMFGLDPTNLQQMTGMFYEMGAAVDLSNDAATKLAMNMTKLSLNVSSLFNVDIEQVSENLISGLRGMSRAVVKYGMDIRASTVGAYTASLGITTPFEYMNEASREIARYIVMVRQAADANSDFSRTINSPANQLRVMKEQALQLSRAIGTFVLGAFNDLIPALEATGGLLGLINGLLMGIRLIVEEIARFFGLFNDATPSIGGGLEEVEDGINGVGSSADGAAKKVNKLLAPFDELNILSEEASKSAGSGSGISFDGIVDPRLLQELEKTESVLGEIRMKAFNARDALLKFFGLKYKLKLDPETGEVIGKLEKLPGEFADKFTEAIEKEDYHEAGSLLGNKLSEAIDSAKEFISWDNLGGAITEGITGVAQFINGFVQGFSWLGLGELIGESITTALKSVNLALIELNFQDFGRAVADILNGVFLTLQENPGLVGETIANWLNACVNFASGFANNFEWEAFKDNLVASIETFFSTFNFEEFLNTAETILRNLVDAMVAVVDAVPWENLGENIAEMMKRIPWEDIIDTALFLLKQLIIAGVAIVQNAPWEMLGSKIAEWLPTLPWEDMLTAAETVINSLIDAVVALDEMVDWFEVGKAIADWIDSLDWLLLLETVASAIVSTLSGLLSKKISEMAFSLPSKLPGIGTSNAVSGVIKSIGGMATGGVVTAPSVKTIGEGVYDEAVIPLGDSPQLEDMLNRFADKVSTTPAGATEVRVYIGDKEWDAFTYKSAKRGERIVGSTPVKEGSYA